MLLHTKIIAPPQRPNLVVRKRLFDKLAAGLKSRVALIAAPAGFGKTTLVNEWISRSGLAAAWFTIDETDNDIGRFLAYLLAAASGFDPSLKQQIQTVTGRPILSFQRSIITSLINFIGSISDPESGSRDLILVLDDYQEIANPAIHDIVFQLIENQPSNLFLIISSRIVPPIPLARLRAQGQLLEISADDLRFTAEETVSLLRQTSAAEITSREVQVLSERTEGWAAGLQMAILAIESLSSKDGPLTVSNFIEEFSGSDRFIVDYLVEEVVNKQPESVQRFLVNTSILDQMSGDLCDFLLDYNNQSNETPDSMPDGMAYNGKEMLAVLERKNLFVVPLDNERRWYRYHQLFRDLLRQRLMQRPQKEIQLLHSRASAWYRANDSLPDAVEHALEAGEFESAAELIEDVAESTLMNSEISTFVRWLDMLPEMTFRSRPRLSIYSAVAMLLIGRSIDAVQVRLELALRGRKEGELEGEIGVLQALLAALKGDMHLGIEKSRRALEYLPGDSHFLRSIALDNLGGAHMATGNIALTSRALEEAIRTARQTGNIMVSAVAICQLAEQRELEARLHDAHSLFREALELATDPAGKPLPIAGMALIGIGGLFRQWNRLDEAEQYLRRGIQLSERWGAVGTLAGYLALARIKLAQGDSASAAQLITKCRQLAVQFDASEMDDLLVDAHQARLQLAQGDLEAAWLWVERRGLTGVGTPDDSTRRTGGNFHLQEVENLTLARVLIAEGDCAAALALLDQLLDDAKKLNRTGSAIEILILQALTHQASGNEREAEQCLVRALKLAEPGGYIRLFADEGAAMASLVSHTGLGELDPAYAAKLVKEMSHDKRPSPQVQLPPEIEALSPRELEVLELVESGRSNKDIAAELVIAPSTVKWHVHNICAKLDARNRTEAVAKARKLRLL